MNWRQVLRSARAKRAHVWVGPWLRDRATKALSGRPREQHLLFAICDHFEPLHGHASHELGLVRVHRWREALPRVADGFRDTDGRRPRHTFFFPGEEYDGALLEPLAELVTLGLGEIEVHLHHDGDTRATLADKLRRTLRDYGKHGVVPYREDAPAWSFIHGNWSLANGRADGRWCGVDDELELLRELGCYADFTFPSAPDPCQPRVVNRIYYPRDPARRRAYDDAEPIRVGASPRDRVLLLQGPLGIARRLGRRGGLRIDAGAIDAGDPPSARRLCTWIDQWVHLPGRPEWTFVKVHTHGATERNARALLGEPIAELHGALAALAASGHWRVHYVTAREMYNVARAAMDGRAGSPAKYFDYEVPPPERACGRAMRVA
jgi:hypothetical protein